MLFLIVSHLLLARSYGSHNSDASNLWPTFVLHSYSVAWERGKRLTLEIHLCLYFRFRLQEREVDEELYEEVPDRRTTLIMYTKNGWMTTVCLRDIFLILIYFLKTAWAKIWHVFKKELRHIRKDKADTWMVLFVDSHPAHIYDPIILEDMLHHKV